MHSGGICPVYYRTNLFLCLIVIFLFFSCTTTSNVSKKSGDSGTVEQGSSGEGTEIAVPKTVRNSYFYQIDETVLSDIEFGSPLSLRRAVGKLRRADAEYTEPEKVLLSVAAGITTIAWPSSTVTWETPEVTEATPYLGALDSAEQGVYDNSTGDVDFLALELPSLVLLTSSSRTDYYDKARKALESALQIKSDSMLANYLYGILLRRMERNQDALPYLKKASDVEKSCLETNYELADCYRAVGNKTAAVSIAEGLVLQYPDNIKILKLCAETTFAVGQYTEAEQYVARVLQKQPDNAEYILFRARILTEKGDFIKAAALLDVYARTNNTSRDYLLLRSRIQRDWNKNYPAAIATMEKALSLYSSDKEIILFAAGLALSSNVKIDKMTAGELAEKVLKDDPSNASALDIYVRQLMRDSLWSNAYIYSEKLMALSDAPTDAVFNHIEICLTLKKMDEAWQLASSLYKKNPGDDQVLQYYLKVLISTGRTSEALNLINQLLPGASSKMKSFLYYRRSFLVSGDEASLSDLRSSLIANPRNSDTLFRMYSIYYHNKDYRKAQYYLKQVIALNPSDESLMKLNEDLEKFIGR